MLAGLKSLWRTTGGTAGIEFAIAAPVLVAILIPLTDLGMAGITVLSVPSLMLFFFLQRYFIQGLSSGAVRG